MPAFFGTRRALLGTAAASALVVALDLTAATALPSYVAFSRASNAMQWDSSGKLTYAPNNLLTYSDDQTNAIWNATSSGTTQTAGSVTFGTTAYRYQGPINISSAKYIASVVLSGSGTIVLRDANGGGAATITLTGTPTRYFVLGTTQGGAVYVGLDNRTGQGGDGVAKTVTVSGFTLSTVTYETAPRAADQVITTSAAYYGPRFDYPNGVAAGLLIEESRANPLLKSIPTTTGDNWPASSSTISVNQAVGPDGLTTFAKFLETSATSGHGAYQNAASATVTAATVYTTNMFVMTGLGRTKARLSYGGPGIADGVYAEFDLTGSGSVITNATAFGAGVATSGSAKIQSFGGGIYRLSVAGTVGNNGAGYAVINSLDASGAYSFAGDTSKGLYYGYAQIELGSFATSYIPTTSAAATRSASLAALSTYASNAIIVERQSVQTGTVDRIYYAPGTFPANFPANYWYRKLAVYARALSVNEQSSRLSIGAPF